MFASNINETTHTLHTEPHIIWICDELLYPLVVQDKIRKRLVDSARRAAAEEAFHFTESAGHDDTLQRTGR